MLNADDEISDLSNSAITIRQHMKNLTYHYRTSHTNLLNFMQYVFIRLVSSVIQSHCTSLVICYRLAPMKITFFFPR